VLQRAHHAIDVRLRRLSRHAWLQPRKQPEQANLRDVWVLEKGRPIERSEELRGFVGRHAEARRHDADHLMATEGE
jgi:hypothetical protein